MAQTVTFKLDKETRLFQRFVNNEGDVRGTLYLTKELAGDQKEIVADVVVAGK